MKITNILWDFDGVILDSMKVRDWGFRIIFKNFSKIKVERLIEYHRENGGLSRYVKIRYFYEKILQKDITEEKVLKYANDFSILMKKELVNEENLIQDSVNFIKLNHQKYNFHIVSGSDQEELRFLCAELNLNNFFISIQGSPTPKKVLVKDLISNFDYDIDSTALIGDSINDFDAAIDNNITFIGYNNNKLQTFCSNYVKSFKNLSPSFNLSYFISRSQ